MTNWSRVCCWHLQLHCLIFQRWLKWLLKQLSVNNCFQQRRKPGNLICNCHSTLHSEFYHNSWKQHSSCGQNWNELLKNASDSVAEFIQHCILYLQKFKMIQLYSKTLCGVEDLGYEHVDNTINSWPHVSFKILIAAICPRELTCRSCTQAGIHSPGTASRYRSLSQLLQCRWILLWETAWRNCWSDVLSREKVTLFTSEEKYTSYKNLWCWKQKAKLVWNIELPALE